MLKTPKWIDAEITGRCNARCSSCTSPGPSGADQDLPAEEWLQFFEELNGCAVPGITLSGGEPFIREDLEELIEGIVENRMRFSIRTNGMLITDEMASMLAATGRCDSVQVIIDSPIVATREAFQASGDFYTVLQGVKTLQRHHLNVFVQVTVARQNLHDLEGITRLLLDELRLPAIAWGSASPMGLCKRNTTQAMLTPEERTHAMGTLLALATKYRTRISGATGPLADARNWLRMAGVSAGKIEQAPAGGFLSGCTGPAHTLAVRADGVMVPCTQLPHIYLGKINEDSMKEVWQDHPELALLRRRHKIPLDSFESCTDCGYVRHCSGGCAATAYVLTGSTEQPSPYDCFKKFLYEGGRLPDVQKRLESEQSKRRVAC